MELRGQGVGQHRDALPCRGGRLPAGRTAGQRAPQTHGQGVGLGTLSPRGGDLPDLTWGSGLTLRPGCSPREGGISVCRLWPPTTAELWRGPPGCVYR